MFDKLKDTLTQLRRDGGHRISRPLAVTGHMVQEASNQQRMVNFSGNDYLGLASDTALQQAFFDHYGTHQSNWMTSSSSRPLTGTSLRHAELERSIANSYQKEAALLFNSGYHANTGILSAITGKGDLVLADKLVHASVIDGLKLSQADYKRFAHNNMSHLEQLLAKFRDDYHNVWIVTESVFSMDGDVAPLAELVRLKKAYNALLYVDEAHAVGSIGQQGLGLAVAQDQIEDVDLLIGTFGKALAGYGGFAAGNAILIDAMINFSRSWLFSTALPPINIDWNLFIWQQLDDFAPQRQQLAALTTQFKAALTTAKQQYLGETYIVPLLKPGNHQAIAVADALHAAGLLALPIRSPTVAAGSERIRFSLTANLPADSLQRCVAVLAEQSAEQPLTNSEA